MASIEEVKAALAQAAEQGNSTQQQIRAAIEATEQTLARLRAVAAGTGHPIIAEAIARGEQSKQRLVEAMTLLQGSSQLHERARLTSAGTAQLFGRARL